MSKPTKKPRKRNKKKKPQPILFVRVTAAEKAVIGKASQVAGMTEAAWTRFVLAQQAYAVVPRGRQPKGKAPKVGSATRRAA